MHLKTILIKKNEVNAEQEHFPQMVVPFVSGRARCKETVSPLKSRRCFLHHLSFASTVVHSNLAELLSPF
eukprot:6470438-Amphidinium_carterae.1